MAGRTRGRVTIGGAGVARSRVPLADVAGKQRPPRSLPVKIDGTPPVTTARINGACAAVRVRRRKARVAFLRTDGDGSGVVGDRVPVSATALWTPYTGAFDLWTPSAATGSTSARRDLVGNLENFSLGRLHDRPGATGVPARPRSHAGPRRSRRSSRWARRVSLPSRALQLRETRGPRQLPVTVDSRHAAA